MKKLFTLFAIIGSLAAQAQFQFDIAGATATYVTGINDSGYICGYFTNAAGTSGFFFNGKDTIIIDGAKITGATYVVCGGLNNTGYVIGYWNSGSATTNLPFRYNWKQNTVSNTYTIQSSGYTNIVVSDIDDNLTISGDCWGGGGDRRFWSESTSGITFTEHYVNGSVYATYGGGGHNGNFTTGYYISGVEKFGFVFNFSNSTYTFDNLLSGGLHKSVPGGMNKQGHYVIDVGTGSKAYICTDYTNAAANLVPIHMTGAVALHPLHINNFDYTCGWFTDAANNTHGYYEKIYDIGFRPRNTQGDGWSFANDGAVLFPPSEYALSYATDPYKPWSAWQALNTGSSGFPLDYFPTWPIFAKTFGDAFCYETDPNGVLHPRMQALTAWHSMLEPTWAGACFGMTGNAIVRYNNRSTFEAYSPVLILADYMTAFAPTHAALQACNDIQLASDKSQQFKNQRAAASPDIETNLAILQTLLSDTSPGSHHPVIAMNVTAIAAGANNTGAHAVVPFRIEKDTILRNGDVWISIYDPNKPGDETRKIIIHRVAGTSTYTWNYQIFDSPVVIWGNNANYSGFFQVMDPYPAFTASLVPATVPNSGGNMHGSRSAGQFTVSISDSTEHLIVNSVNDTTGYYNGVYKNNIPNTVAYFPLGGASAFVNNYALNNGDTYNTNLKTTKNQSISTWMQLDSANLLGMILDTSVANDLNKVVFDNGLTYLNPAASSRKVSMQAIVANNYYYALTSVPMAQNSSLKISPINNTELRVDNTGPATHYALDITAEPHGAPSRFHFDSIPFATNTTHIIRLVSDTVSTSGIWIFVDTGQTGTIVDTMFVLNQLAPKLVLSKHIDTLSNSANADSIGIANDGGGTLTWNVSSTPSWITVASGNAGTQGGKTIFNYTVNTGTPRSGYIVFTASGATNSPDSVFVFQDVAVTTPISSRDDEGNSITIYPNPSSGILNIELSAQTETNTSILIYDLNGREVLQSRITNAYSQVNIQNLATGTYLLKIISDKNSVVKKLVKF